jgi:serine protease inhibitor
LKLLFHKQFNVADILVSRLISKIYDQLNRSKSENENLLWCPICITNSLAILFHGAGGETREEIGAAVFGHRFPEVTKHGFHQSAIRLSNYNSDEFRKDNFKRKKSFTNFTA